MNIVEQDYNFRSNPGIRRTTSQIILHHAAASIASPQTVNSWHKGNGWSGIGYHFYITKDGIIVRGRPENWIGSHASGNNNNSIGICFEGNFESESPTATQITAGKELVAYLKGKYGNITVKGHRDVNPTSCPGKNFPMGEFTNVPVGTAKPTPAPPQQPTGGNNNVRRFQSELNAQFGAGLVVDGIWGNNTASKAVVVKRGAKGNLTRLIQERMNAHGHGITVDGDFGGITYREVRRFQRNNSLADDGVVGKNTWYKLLV